MDSRRQAGPSHDQVNWLWDTRAFYKLWFDTMSQAMDAYLRSTTFLRFMQHGLRSMSASGSAGDDTEPASPPKHRPQIPV